MKIGKIVGGNDYDSNRIWNKKEDHKNIIGFIEDDNILTQKIRIIESFIGDSGFVGFLINSENKIKLYNAFGRNGIEKLDLTIEDYLSIHLDLLGFWNWLYIFHEGKDSKIDSKPLVNILKKVFPDFDLSRIIK